MTDVPIFHPPLVPTFGHIQVEEVTVEDGLYHPGHHCNLVVEIFSVVPPDPVSQIKSSIKPQKEKVVSGDGLCLPSPADHEKLG